MFGAKFVFTTTARYVTHMLKLWCHYASHGKLCNVPNCTGIALLKSYSDISSSMYVVLHISMRFKNLY